VAARAAGAVAGSDGAKPITSGWTVASVLNLSRIRENGRKAGMGNMNDTSYYFVVAYESIGLDVEETLKGRLSYIRRVITATREKARQKKEETGHPHRLMVGIDVIGRSRQEGAKVVVETFGALVSLLMPLDDIYVAWNPYDEPRYVRDLASGLRTRDPDMYVLRRNGQVESIGVDFARKGAR